MGFPSPAEDFTETSLSLDTLCVRHRAATFFMRASEGSIRQGIFNSTVLIVDKSLTPVDGSVIVAAIEGEFKLRRFKTYPACGLERLDYPGKLERFNNEEGIVVFGVVTFVLNNMRTGEFDENPAM